MTQTIITKENSELLTVSCRLLKTTAEGITESEFESTTDLPAGKYENNNYRSTISFNISDLIPNTSIVKSVKLRLIVGNVQINGPITIDGIEYNLKPTDLVELDLTEKVLASSDGNVVVTLDKSDENGVVFFNKAGRKAPTVEVTYSTNQKIRPIREYSSMDKVSHKIDVYSGEEIARISDLTDNTLPFAVSLFHTYKKSIKDYGVGANFKLNLHEKLIDGQIYQDAYGYNHTFKDLYYYYNEYGTKMFINKEDVSVDIDNSLYLQTVYLGKVKVYHEQVSLSGLKLTNSILEDFRNVELIDQRSSEIKQLEEKISSYENVLKDFVVISVTQGEVVTTNQVARLTDLSTTGFETFKSQIGENYLLSIADSFQFRLLYTQDTSNDLVSKQITIYQERSDKNKQLIDDYFKEYFNSEKSLVVYKRKQPVNYITDGNLVKGFNEQGDLVVIFDSNNNVAWVERDESDKILRVATDTLTLFSFDYKGNELVKLTAFNGEWVEYTYNADGFLTQLTYSSGKVIEIAYNAKQVITSIKDKELLLEDTTVFTRPGAWMGIRTYVTDKEVDGSSTEVENVAQRLELKGETYVFSEGQTKVLTLGEIADEYYLFDADGNKSAYFYTLNSLVTKAERYSYTGTSQKTIEYANKNKLNLSSFSSDFDFGVTDSVVVTYNEFNKVATKTTTIWLTADKKQTQVTTYFYDSSNRVIKEENLSTLIIADSVVEEHKTIDVTVYDGYGRVIKTESYVEGEEKTCGKTVTESVYDKSGLLVKEINYNTLDSSSKYYTEKVINENGQVEKEYDQTGKNFTEYEYLGNAMQKLNQKLPNGSSFSYGENNGKVTAVTQSDEFGEENSNQIEYNYGLQTKVESENFKVEYKYEPKKRVNLVKVNDEIVLQSEYTDHGRTANNDVVRNRYHGNQVFENEYDYKGNLLVTKYAQSAMPNAPSFTTQMQYAYDEHNKLTTAYDRVTGLNSFYTYDDQDRVLSQDFGNNRVETIYSTTGEVVSKELKVRASETAEWQSVSDGAYNYTYSNDSRKQLQSMSVGNITENYTYDSLDRSKSISQTLGDNTYKKEFGYYKNGDRATDLINVVYNKVNGQSKDKTTYTYDSMGNIISVNKNGVQTKAYTYDSLNRLIKENNIDLGKEIVYTYDNQGNILSKTENGVEKRYVYDENGLNLLSFGDQNYAYDYCGNPTNLNATYTQINWGRFNQISSILKDDQTGITFSYYGDGLLRRKIDNGVTTTYEYENGRLLRETVVTNAIDYIYGKEGVIGFKYNSATYLYQKNIFGDIEKILDNTGNVVAEYSYTAFGECSIITDTNGIASLNKIRYRGYYLLDSLNLYYLKTRLYNPVTGRFISPDDTQYLQPDIINGLNLFVYCGNNPITNIDPNGNAWWNPRDWNWKAIGKIAAGVGIVAGATIASIVTGGAASVLFAGAAIGSAAGFVSGGVSALVSGGGLNTFANGALMGSVTGAISGAVAASPIGVGGQMVANSILNITTTIIQEGSSLNMEKLLYSTISGIMTGVLGGNGWMTRQTTSAFIAFAGKNALKHTIGMLGGKTLLQSGLTYLFSGLSNYGFEQIFR